ncbi:glyoxalase [Pseudoroseicyclus aestuarii]|uniref:VOC domain-containing protein n=1 Tax=Pseudoroseicyclus aestuarii TaxID=1795041 RepID=A0A318SS60_9RHOB|nr:glyoxalase [Pseudoroseicyclus aestuarii]PYE80576.1 hypothetical protein DFP88_11511 [Pseudoroseicyclus aestuarii]
MTCLDHVTLRTAHLGATRQFFIEIFGLREGIRPPEIRRIPGHWLYEGDEPIVHLIGTATPGGRFDGDMIDHIAFRLDDYDGFMGKLRARGLPHSCMSLKGLGEHRVFLHAPGRQLIEVVFRGDAAQRAFAAQVRRSDGQLFPA